MEQKPILFYSPYYYTTKGHKSISLYVKRAIEKIWPGGALIVGGSGRHLFKVRGEDIAFALFDFPDTGARTIIQSWITQNKETPNGYLQMHAPNVDPDVADPIEYDYRFTIEPGVSLVNKPAYSIIESAPFVRRESIEPLTPEELALIQEPGGFWERMGGRLALVSGSVQEAGMVHHYAQSIWGMKYIESPRLPQSATRFAAHATSILAACGYSTAWELLLMGVTARVNWFNFHRPAEDCQARWRCIQGSAARHSAFAERPPFTDALAGVMQQYGRIIHSLVQVSRDGRTDGSAGQREASSSPPDW